VLIGHVSSVGPARQKAIKILRGCGLLLFYPQLQFSLVDSPLGDTVKGRADN
jgi:hypothetical protein